MKASCMPVFLTHAKGEPALTAGDEALVCKACINELWGPHALTHRNACNKLHALVLPVWALDPVPHLFATCKDLNSTCTFVKSPAQGTAAACQSVHPQSVPSACCRHVGR